MDDRATPSNNPAGRSNKIQLSDAPARTHGQVGGLKASPSVLASGATAGVRSRDHWLTVGRSKRLPTLRSRRRPATNHLEVNHASTATGQPPVARHRGHPPNLPAVQGWSVSTVAGRHRRHPHSLRVWIPEQRRCAVGITDARTHIEHLVTAESVAAHRHAGHYPALCGTRVLAASLIDPGRGWCRQCRR